jgi:hypothetical protein
MLHFGYKTNSISGVTCRSYFHSSESEWLHASWWSMYREWIRSMVDGRPTGWHVFWMSLVKNHNFHFMAELDWFVCNTYIILFFQKNTSSISLSSIALLHQKIITISSHSSIALQVWVYKEALPDDTEWTCLTFPLLKQHKLVVSLSCW